MKIINIKKLVIVLITALSVFAGKFDSAVRAFESQPKYVEPIATVLGTIGGTGWQNSSFVSKSLRGAISLPISITILHDKDRIYSDTYIDSGILFSNLPDSVKAVDAYKGYITPTVFGTEPAPTLYKSVTDVDGNIVDSIPVYFSDGIPDVASFNWIPMPTLQAEISYLYTSIKLRYIGRPSSTLSINYPGIGIQHDIKSFLPNLKSVSITAFGNFSFPILKWTPGDGIDGSVDMKGFSTFSGITIGHNFKKANFDLFMEMGWEYSKLTTGGELYITSDDEWVRPNMDLIGRNMFRASVVIGFSPGNHYRANGSASVGAEQAYTLTPLAFRFGDKDKENIINEKSNIDSIESTTETVTEEK